ncbi:hypothetical protein [Patulibacter sp.]|uniref:hypothetical protein n=1 Tax=Patulibacter sp. TaxID=1912859 RepID=UPI00271B25B0|nr:hypothetical protein [Patulibacter sp.]MDO9410373.1 hypothetical protein [Patulibacter sp.]
MLVPTMALLMITLALGLAMLSVVDTQARESGRQRVSESTFNLAEGTANATAAVLADGWPARTTATCALPMAEGGLDAPADPVTVPERIRAILASSYTDGDYDDGAAWEVHLCDDGLSGTHQVTWSDDALTQPAWDANGNGRMWIRAQATVGGRRQAMARLVQVGTVSPLPTGYAAIAGQLSFAGDLSVTLNSLLTGALLGPFVDLLVTNDKLIQGGKLGIRCGLLPSLCTTSASAAVSTIPLLQSALLGTKVQQYGAPTALRARDLDDLVRQATTTNTSVAQVAAGAPCIPSGAAATAVVYVEKVGDGSGQCTVPTQTQRIVIVGQGGIKVAANASYTGVLLALNRQAPAKRLREVVTIGSRAKVTGAVFVDGGGTVGLPQPNLDLCAVDPQLLGNVLGLGSLFGGLTCTLTNVLNATNTTAKAQSLVTGLLPQLSGYGPAVVYGASQIAAVTTRATVATVPNTYMQIAPHER